MMSEPSKPIDMRLMMQQTIDTLYEENERLTALLDAEMESNHRLAAKELELTAEVERAKERADFWHKRAQSRQDHINHRKKFRAAADKGQSDG